MATAAAMYHSGKDPLHKVSQRSDSMFVAKGANNRRLHKAFLRYHDANNWPLLRDALHRMGRQDLIGNSKRHVELTGEGLSEVRLAAARGAEEQDV